MAITAFIKTETLFNSKGKVIPVAGLDRPLSFQEVEAPRLQVNWRMKVVSLSALRNGRLYHPENIPGTHFCCSSVGIVTDYGLDRPGSNPDGDEIFRLSRTVLGSRPPVK